MDEAPPIRNPLRRLFGWVLGWAETPYGWLALILVSFGDSSCFPIPPDPLLMALVLGARNKAWRLAAACTAASVAGAALGYWIGSTAWAVAEPMFIPHLFKCHHFLEVGHQYADNAFLAIFTAAFTPIPFKVFTISAGIYSDLVGFGTLMFASVVGRGARFFLVAGLLFFFGPPVRRFIDKHLEWLTLLFTVLLVGGILLIKSAGPSHDKGHLCPEGQVVAEQRCVCVDARRAAAGGGESTDEGPVLRQAAEPANATRPRP